MGYGIMDMRKMMSEPDMKWCDVGRGYFERYIVGNDIVGLNASVEYIKNDVDYDQRIEALCAELNMKNTIANSKKNTLRLLRNLLGRDAIVEQVCNFESTDEYRLTKDGNVLLEGTLTELELFKAVEYDDNEWWFAKSAQGTLLNNEQEVNDYQSNILRERKYVDKDIVDDFVLWKAE